MRKPVTTEAINPEKFQGWGKLEPLEQTKLTVEIQAFERAADAFEMSTLEVGEHLDNINRVLSPKRQFNKWLLWWLEGRKKAKSRSWAYQAMKEYQELRSSTPKLVLEIAKERGTKLNAQALVHNPPPKTNNRSEIIHYLDSQKLTRVEVVKSSDTLLRECVNFVSTRWGQLPRNSAKTKNAFIHDLIGMLLGKFGIASPQTFSPVAAPDTFKRGRKKAA